MEALLAGPRGGTGRAAASPAGAAAVFNPYRQQDRDLDRPGAARRRLLNLEAYLAVVGRPRWVLVGEALGYRGGRFSGIAFTSERQLAGSRGERLAWAAEPSFAATSRNPALWIEPSGTIVWNALGGVPAGVLLWNSFPWHPAGRSGPLSNRRPESRLVAANLGVLEQLLVAVAPARPLAVGRTAEAALRELGRAAPSLRHPAYGGATLFRQQLATHLVDPRVGKVPGAEPARRATMQS